MHMCDICEAGFVHKRSLLRHQRTKHKTSVSSCNNCSCVFTRHDNLLKHIQLKHSGESTEHPCTLCDKSFNTAANLQRHITNVHKDTLHVCGRCQASYSRSDNLKRHLMKCGGLNHHCPRCNDVFDSKKDLVVHMKLCPFPRCVTCERVFANLREQDCHECSLTPVTTVKQATGKSSFDIVEVLDQLESAPSLELASYELCKENPALISAIYVLERRAKRNKQVERTLHKKEKASEITWLPWQHELKQELDGVAHDRKIIVYVDYNGNKGKTFFAKHYSALNPYDTIKLNNGKTDNLRYFITKCDNVRCVIFDFTRQTIGEINWQFVEELKDGKFMSHKYDCQMVDLDQTPHVVCMMNTVPNTSMLSLDRWDIRILGSNGQISKKNVL